MLERVRRIPAEPACLLLVASAYAAHLFLSGYDRFYYDSLRYWELADLFKRDADFSLLSYDFAFRGYSLPLLSYVLQAVASGLGLGDVTIVKLTGAVLAATVGVVVLPRLARRLFPDASIGWGRVLALNALIFLYWRDHFDFPLSDFPALSAAAVGLLGLLRGTPPGYLLAGFGFGLAANLRPAYLPAVIAAVAVAGLVPRRPWSWRRRSSAAALVLAAGLVVSLPQILINHRHHETWSPVVTGGRDISMLQLTEGMFAQKYETYVGDPAGYPQPQVFYLDPATTHVLEREGISQISSYGEYARIIAEHPAEMAASYVRRIFNGLDVRYPTPYIRDLEDSSIVLSLLQYTLIFVAIVRMLLPDARRAFGPIRWVALAVLISPCLSAIPGAVEPRFFLPLQILIYMIVCFGPATRTLLGGGSIERRGGIAATYVAFLVVCLSMSSSTQAQLEHPGPTLGVGAPEVGGSAPD